MTIQLNGEPRPLSRPLTVRELLSELALDGKPVAVELNRRILKRSDFDQVQVRDGDELEIVTFVGGG